MVLADHFSESESFMGKSFEKISAGCIDDFMYLLKFIITAVTDFFFFLGQVNVLLDTVVQRHHIFGRFIREKIGNPSEVPSVNKKFLEENTQLL